MGITLETHFTTVQITKFNLFSIFKIRLISLDLNIYILLTFVAIVNAKINESLVVFTVFIYVKAKLLLFAE